MLEVTNQRRDQLQPAIKPPTFRSNSRSGLQNDFDKLTKVLGQHLFLYFKGKMARIRPGICWCVRSSGATTGQLRDLGTSRTKRPQYFYHHFAPKNTITICTLSTSECPWRNSQGERTVTCRHKKKKLCSSSSWYLM